VTVWTKNGPSGTFAFGAGGGGGSGEDGGGGGGGGTIGGGSGAGSFFGSVTTGWTGSGTATGSGPGDIIFGVSQLAHSAMKVSTSSNIERREWICFMYSFGIFLLMSKMLPRVGDTDSRRSNNTIF
jgi:hypothetical protein